MCAEKKQPKMRPWFPLPTTPGKLEDPEGLGGTAEGLERFQSIIPVGEVKGEG